MSISPTFAGEPLFLGLDFGTSGARISLINSAGAEHFQTGVSFSENIWQEWQQVLRQLIIAIPADLRHRIAALAFCGTSGTALLCDETGQPLLPAILYNDNRYTQANTSSTLAKLLWFLQQPEARSARYFLHQADWLAFLLHGKPGLSDYCNSLKLGYDVEKLAYPEEMRNAKYAALLPQVREPGSELGVITPQAAALFGLPESCVIRAETTDSIAAFFASGATEPGMAVTSLGSTLVLKLLSRTRVESPKHGIYSHRYGNMWLVGGASNCGGKTLEQIFGRERLAALSSQLNPNQSTNLDYYPLPAPGERFPINDPALAPRLEPRPNDDATYLQGLLESLARIENLGYRLLEQLGATPLRAILTAGGGANNAAWTKIRERTIGVTISVAPHTEAAYGAARLAMLGEKIFCSP
ncbi:MAG: FGGY-family carbohydrate kinase [Methylobacillus sp.]|nr:FGGY-family carbohydrate kinase [Methylobacillus sp.]